MKITSAIRSINKIRLTVIKCPVRHFCGQFFKQRLKDIQEDHASDTEADTRIERDAPLEVKGKSAVVPEPFPVGGFHDIAGRQLDSCGDEHDPDEDQKRRHRDLSDTDALLLQLPQTEDEYDRPDSVYDAVRTEEHASVGKSPAVHEHFQKYFIDPSDDGVQHKI